jgi:hypothetical protein
MSVTTKSRKPPTTQRTFASVWGELDYLCRKVHYWLYVRRQSARAQRYRRRLERVLRQLPENDMAIVREEGWALLCELKGVRPQAIAHREREIELMERLHQEATSSRYTRETRAYMLRDRDEVALRERRAILETLKNTNGSLAVP